jgi:hypothetical protein
MLYNGYMKAFRSITLVFIMISLLYNGGIALAQQSGFRYFAETGHSVRGDFLRKYDSARDPLLVYGNPMTEEYLDWRSGRIVQYFQRTRMEYHPEQPDGQRVKLSPLGSWLLPYAPVVPVNSEHRSNQCIYFAETGYSVCGAFRDFYQANGGVAQFGKPISGFVGYGTLIVQFFEYARFDWYPMLSNSVIVADLGRAYFDYMGEDRQLTTPIPAIDAAMRQVLDLNVNVSPKERYVLANGENIIHVSVLDQLFQPVPGALVILTVVYPDINVQRPESYTLQTNEEGFVTQVLRFRDLPPGKPVMIVAEVRSGTLTVRMNASFSAQWP